MEIVSSENFIYCFVFFLHPKLYGYFYKRRIFLFFVEFTKTLTFVAKNKRRRKKGSQIKAKKKKNERKKTKSNTTNHAT